jgi:hypothetical protein
LSAFALVPDSFAILQAVLFATFVSVLPAYAFWRFGHKAFAVRKAMRLSRDAATSGRDVPGPHELIPRLKSAVDYKDLLNNPSRIGPESIEAYRALMRKNIGFELGGQIYVDKLALSYVSPAVQLMILAHEEEHVRQYQNEIHTFSEPRAFLAEYIFLIKELMQMTWIGKSTHYDESRLYLSAA